MAVKFTLYTLQYKCVQFTLSKKIFWQIFFNKSFWGAFLKKLTQYTCFFKEYLITVGKWAVFQAQTNNQPLGVAKRNINIGKRKPPS